MFVLTYFEIYVHKWETSMLPQSLLLLSGAILAAAQSRQFLQINQIASFDTQTLSRPSLAIPQSPESQLSISVALCSASNLKPRFFITNRGNSDSINDPGPLNGPGVFEIVLRDGQGSWTGWMPSGGLIFIVSDSSSSLSFDVGVSTSGTF